MSSPTIDKAVAEPGRCGREGLGNPLGRIPRGYLVKGGVVVVDAIVVVVALYCAYLIREDFAIRPFYLDQMLNLLPIFVLIRISALYYTRSYHFIWKYASVSDLVKILKAIAGGVVVLAVVNYFRNYPMALLLALALFFSALFHRGFLHFLPRARHKRALILAATLGSVTILAAGFMIYTIITSAPMTVAELPFGALLLALDFPEDLAMPRAVLIMEAVLSFVLVSGVRIAPRLFAELFLRGRRQGRRTLIFGAGDVGESIVRALKQQPWLGYWPMGFIDDDPGKQRMSIHGVSVLGTRSDLSVLIERHKAEEILITATALTAQDLREIAEACWQKRVFVRRVPSLSRMVDPVVGLEQLENIDIEELLGRPEVQLDPVRVRAYLEDQVVLVTGAGGSIGSELCRQISRCRPARLVLLGKGENSIFFAQNELRDNYPDVQVVSVIADVCNPAKMDHVFETHKPDVVFHAAAYKHVPFMEDHPEESVTNNIFGTQTVGQAALRHEVSEFVLISSDKAVNPTSMMGATKKVAEMVLQELAHQGVTQFITVRFGNVLRSRGSVIPLFEKQIEAGGPVLVTHPEMKRYFMTIPEAVRLVLHSGAIGRSGDLCILDMGEQVRIVDLARNMIRMAGKRLGEDIDIEYIGIRPGEKLFEELFTEDEARGLQKIEKIFVCRPEGCGWARFNETLDGLRQAAAECRREEIIDLLGVVVPSYTPYVGEEGAVHRAELA